MLRWEDWLRENYGMADITSDTELDNAVYAMCGEWAKEDDDPAITADSYYNNLCDEYGDYERTFKRP